MRVEQKIADMGLEILPPGAPVANYVSSVRTGNLLFVAGHIPFQKDGSVLNPGKVGREVTEEQGYEAAKLAMLYCLASIKQATGDLDKVKQVAKLRCMINSAPDFSQQPQVANGASDLLRQLYGEAGAHARSAVGMGSLPNGAWIETEMIMEVEE